MALLPNDQFYVQRGDGGSKRYKKGTTTLSDIAGYVLDDFNTDLSELDQKIEGEIQDRKDGDSEIYAQIDGLTDRIVKISNELYDTLIQHEYTYAIDAVAAGNFEVLSANNCAGTIGEEFDACKRSILPVYSDSIAGSTIEDSRKKFYLATSNYLWQDVLSVFISDTPAVGEKIDLDLATLGSLIEIINITKDGNGNDVVDNFNYGFYKIINIGPKVLEANSTQSDPSYLYQFDVEHVASQPLLGKPSVQDGDNRYLVKLVIDLQSTLDKVYVNKIGDSMSGGLFVSITDVNNPIQAALTTGIQTTNPVIGPTFKITGFSQLDQNFPVLEITNPKENIVNIVTNEITKFNFNGPWHINHNGATKIKYEPEVFDDLGAITTPAFTTITDRVVLEKASEYLFPPNLISPEYSANPGIIPPRAYVDLMDSLLDNKITDVSQRIDTLANATDVFQYRMLLDGESSECDDSLNIGYDIEDPTNTSKHYPGYDVGDASSYDPTEYENGLFWAQCIAATIKPADSNDPLYSESKIFDWKTFVQDYQVDGGNTEQRDVDVVVIDPRTSVIGSDDPVTLDFGALLKVGDYFEISSSDARTTAYAVYRSVAMEVKPNGVMIITGVELFKNSDVIQQGFNYKIKFYDKTSGLTLDDVNDLFVFKSGDNMTGRLHIRIPSATAEDGLKIHTTEGYKLFSVENTGKTTIGHRDLLLHEDNGDRTFFKFDGEKATSTYYPAVANANGVTFVNTNSQNFTFSFSETPTLEIRDKILNVLGKTIQNVDRCIFGTDAVNKDFLWCEYPQTGGGGSGLANKTSYLVSRSNNLKMSTDENGQVSVDVYKISANELQDFDYGDGKDLQDGHSLIWDPEKGEGGAWVPTSTKATPFIPGDQVCYLGESQQSNVEVGGFYYSSSSSQLQLRVS
jgi:hypothetical protein